jgi:glycerophosphoryl diester phosphodiesterase
VDNGAGFFESTTPLAIAHRGGSAEAPENSWAAFERAAALGYRYMETDVRASADGVAVVIHDPTVDRVTGEAGTVAQMTWPQLKALKLRDGSEIPRLDELLAAWPQLRWNIDVKREAAVDPVVAAIKGAGAEQRVLVASFSRRRSGKVRAQLGPGVATSAGRWGIAMLLVAKAVRFVPIHPQASAAQVPVARKNIRIVDKRFLDVCHRAGVAVHVWTIDEPDEMARLLDLGVDGIMTDRPSVLKQVLCERGQWQPPD